MTTRKLGLCAIVLSMGTLVLAACGGSSSGGSGGEASGTTATGSSSYTCCINDVHYRCPDKAAFDKCAGFDLSGCMAACSPTDPSCMESCNQQAAQASPDPSSCDEDPTAQCGG